MIDRTASSAVHGSRRWIARCSAVINPARPNASASRRSLPSSTPSEAERRPQLDQVIGAGRHADHAPVRPEHPGELFGVAGREDAEDDIHARVDHRQRRPRVSRHHGQARMRPSGSSTGRHRDVEAERASSGATIERGGGVVTGARADVEEGVDVGGQGGDQGVADGGVAARRQEVGAGRDHGRGVSVSRLWGTRQVRVPLLGDVEGVPLGRSAASRDPPRSRCRSAGSAAGRRIPPAH